MGLSTGGGVILGWLLGWYRVPIWLWQSLLAPFRLDLQHNPYLWDAGVRLPIWGARRRLTAAALADPDSGRAFAEFLLEYRPLQAGLAAEVLHAATAGAWMDRPLDPRVLEPPPSVADQADFQPPAPWLRELTAIREDRVALSQQTQISLKRQAYQGFSERLERFRSLTLRQSPAWSRFYLQALDRWRSEAQKRLDQLLRQAASLEPIAVNVYRPGTPLTPDLDRDLFFGREDLRGDLAREILSAREMPLFLIQGQRRVGKTSLLNFLPSLLGSGFQVVYQDLQDGAVDSVGAWMADLRRRVARRLDLEVEDWTPPEDWLSAWTELQAWLAGVAAKQDYKLVLAMDEYETLHWYLHQEPQTGRRLLAALRSFSQHQNQVVFLFVGATPFSELRDPDWSEFFVQALRFQVDYLAHADALRLITEPTPLRYPAELSERLYQLTQGHPELLQRICKQLVDIANREGRHAMTAADLDEALRRAIDQETPAMERFWNEFCPRPACRDCIEAILADRPPTDRVATKRLSTHGYIVRDGERWRLRVPLFEQWLREHRDAFG